MNANDTCIKGVGHRHNPKSSRGLIFQSLTTFPLSASKPTKICLQTFKYQSHSPLSVANDILNSFRQVMFMY